ncbi:MAG TPA: FUSC family protein [Burkholderiales bacterium]
MRAGSYPHRGVFAWRFALNVFVGSTLVWATLRYLEVPDPIWAVASLIAAADPQVKVAAHMFKSRIVNVLVGSAIGLLFLSVGGSSEWKLPLAVAVTVLVSAYLVRLQTMWRQAPITAALIIGSGLTHQSTVTGVEFGLSKTAEVIFGCVVGLFVSWFIARLWPLAELPQAVE